MTPQVCLEHFSAEKGEFDKDLSKVKHAILDAQRDMTMFSVSDLFGVIPTIPDLSVSSM